MDRPGNAGCKETGRLFNLVVGSTVSEAPVCKFPCCVTCGN